MRAGGARAPAEPRPVPAVTSQLSYPSCHLRRVPIPVHPRVLVYPREGEQQSSGTLWEGECLVWSSPSPLGVPREALGSAAPLAEVPLAAASWGSGSLCCRGVRAARLSSQHH